jgi:rhamnogalacturonan endolyase
MKKICMIKFISAATHRILVPVVVLSACLIDTANAQLKVVKPKVNAPVTLTDSAGNWILDNGIVRATISKARGRLAKLVFHGTNVLHLGGVWEEVPQGDNAAITIDPAKNGGELAEVSIKGKGTPTPGMDIELRYAMSRGASGVYTYAIYTHPAANPAVHYAENRFIVELNHNFDWISVDADRNMLECAPQDWGKGVVINAKEQRIMSTGYYKNSVEHKYSYNAQQYKIPAYGWSSTKDHIGVYLINPSMEYLDGGPEKLDLVCHYGANDDPDPIILDYWNSSHYGGGASCSVPAGEEWNKVVGPIMVYCNVLANPKTPSQADLNTLNATAGNPIVPAAWHDNGTALFKDALAQAKVETAKWPYDWVNGVDYPHKNERGTVTGQLVLNDPQAASALLPNLTVGLAHPDYARSGGRYFSGSGNSNLITWQRDGNYYQFWTDGTPNGKFTIANVRPGTYTLHAFADGVLGEFAQTEITVVAGKTLNLGKLVWKPVREGKQVWEIGYPNRNSSEFLKGDGENYWLWGWPLRYPLLFPNDITYTIGKSDYHKDWFFEQVPHGESTDWENPEAKDLANQRFGWMKAGTPGQDMWRTSISHGRATTWTIKFNMNKAEHGLATLRLALAGADGRGGLEVGVNGHSVGHIQAMSTNALRYNTDKGVWHQYSQPFDAALLKQGENEMTLTVPAGDLKTGVVYDYLRLELDENAKPSIISQ